MRKERAYGMKAGAVIFIIALIVGIVSYVISFKSEYNKDDLQKALLMCCAVLFAVFLFCLLTA